jgi:hypothetical protein
MEIYTETAEQYEKGDSIAIKGGKNVITVGKVRDRKDNILFTSIPDDSVASNSQIVNGEQNNNWVRRFESSQYQLYMMAEVNNSGNISISGV